MQGFIWENILSEKKKTIKMPFQGKKLSQSFHKKNLPQL